MIDRCRYAEQLLSNRDTIGMEIGFVCAEDKLDTTIIAPFRSVIPEKAQEFFGYLDLIGQHGVRQSIRKLARSAKIGLPVAHRCLTGSDHFGDGSLREDTA